MADETISPPAAWKATDVAAWATQRRLAPEVISSLIQNEVDGPTLLTLTKSDLRSELGVESLPARRYVWELIQSLKSEQETCDYSVAIEFHAREVDSLSLIQESRSYPEGPDAASGIAIGVDATSISSVVHELYTDVQRQRRIIEDHMMAFELQKMLNNGYEVCQDAELAHREQERVDQLFTQSESDQKYAESLARGRERAVVNRKISRTNSRRDDGSYTLSCADSRVSSLLGICIETCSENKIDVAEAFRTGKVKPMGPGALVSDEESSGEEDRKPSAVPRAIFNLPFVEQCNVCYEENLKGYIFACGHLQCVQCTRKLFQTALGDNKIIPLRCCDVPIDMNIAKDLLESDDAKLLFRRAEEKRAKNKMYCPSCSSFINLDLIDPSAGLELRCECGAMVCISCKTDSHPGLTCQENRAIKSGSDELVLKMSREKGWKQCPKCSVLIELRSGCNHVTCTSCSHEFCYSCLQSWDTKEARCSSGTCNLWDEDRLIEAGEARVRQEEAAGGGRRLPELIRRMRFDNAVRGLRANEVCNHRWVRSNGYKGGCPNCGFEMWAYGMRCTSECGSVVCYTCAHHRIPRRGWR